MEQICAYLGSTQAQVNALRTIIQQGLREGHAHETLTCANAGATASPGECHTDNPDSQ